MQKVTKTVNVEWPSNYLQNQQIVTLPAKILGPADGWARIHCKSYICWRYHLVNSNTITLESVDFIFKMEDTGLREAEVFLLRWS